MPASDEGFTNNTVENLKAAQEDANKQRLVANLMEGAAKLSAGALGGKRVVLTPDTHFTDEMRKGADQKVKDFEALTEKEKDDRGSKGSIKMQGFAKQMLEKAGFDPSLVDGMSYNQIEKNFPQITNMMTQKQAQEARQQTAREHNDMLKLRYAELTQDKSKSNGEREDRNTLKRYDDLGKRLVAEIASGRSTFGTHSKTLAATRNIRALMDGRDLNDLDSREVYEVAKSLDRVLSQSGSTISGTDKLTPDTAMSRVEKQLEFITNKRKGAGAASFLERYQKNLQREEDQAIRSIQKSQGQLLSSYSDLREKDPVKWALILGQHNLPEDILERKIDSLDSINTEDKEAIEWAKANPKNPDAIQILKLHGIK
jgi:hypothetical protein